TLQIVASGESATEVKAVPNEGYSFQKWLKNGTELSKDNPLVVSEVNENMTIQAVISQNIYTLTYVAGEHGSIKGAALQRVVHGGTGTPVTAVPDEGYEFTEWSDGVKDNPRTDANVKSDISVTAQFAQKQAWTNFEILRTQARSNRSIAAKGLKDSYNFKIKAQVPNDFSWNEILNEEVKISFGDNFNFAGTLNPINSKYDVFNLQKGGRATFVENLLSLNTEMRKARKISLRWNKKNELYITMRNIQAPGKQDNIIGVNDFEFVPERELI
ncbi:MAG: InlB B-repeat-containing protein, partial [Candidatus Nanoarchaeia archaeon]